MFARQRARYEEQCPDALEHYDHIMLSAGDPSELRDDGRCSGLVECEVCGRQLYDHPQHPIETWMTITCDGRVVKL